MTGTLNRRVTEDSACIRMLDQINALLPMFEMYQSSHDDYSKSVYEDTWEDLGVLCETWKALHGVDTCFCRTALQQYANYLKREE